MTRRKKSKTNDDQQQLNQQCGVKLGPHGGRREDEELVWVIGRLAVICVAQAGGGGWGQGWGSMMRMQGEHFTAAGCAAQQEMEMGLLEKGGLLMDKSKDDAELTMKDKLGNIAYAGYAMWKTFSGNIAATFGVALLALTIFWGWILYGLGCMARALKDFATKHKIEIRVMLVLNVILLAHSVSPYMVLIDTINSLKKD
ncbi:hypothetical protein DACRYDRAFT_112192 [Dacryopinax primogenitus]|uniref:Uncharacterized protein n=1 Tax=Dacryopinax primogenitus (strain DJM 731) TaxID=1858805 RepID=M5FN54_DACPD|nr:uncharacterized protein DACRYDRAFT_112192 [Dacryopinax primogenitus]EJT96850.1 hypothetical protein DACRYDRAFT_112192 [Dacryopinax primogenitus]